ncbi:AMP-binding protein [Pseudoalteromonas luteoviolacea]|uniref:non-ribosomal peptide synthetase n=1 Tax=Pseudoalteromonas luteoviolacea TaxID=43657 RepID=UPI001B38F291|nr:AMP-binding protein [Pseudoalteromonas luteoviolacea]MBQ4812495.1 AMP-binding protein [Pseudoalteromonas luteoviolacea]
MFRNLVERLRYRAIEFPTELAIMDDCQSYSNEALWQKVNNRAVWFLEKGIKAQDKVAVCQPRNVDLVVSILALVSIRAVFVPIDRQLSHSAINSRLKKAQCKVFVSDKPPKFRMIGSTTVELAKEQKMAKPLSKCEPYRFGDLAYILFTSGSTGEPKGVMVKYDSMYRHLAWKTTVYPVASGSIELLKAPLSFDVSIRELFGFLFSKNALFILSDGEEKRPDILCKKISQLKLKEISVVPSFLFALVTYIDKFVHIDELASLQRVLVGGEVLPSSLVNTFIRIFGKNDVSLINLYGPTEATIEVTHFDCLSQAHTNTQSVPIGKPIYRDTLFILDVNGCPVRDGDIGELYIAGEQVALGYVGLEEETNKAFKTNWLSGKRTYKTGDLVKRLEDGHLVFCGRVDRQVKVSGKIINLDHLARSLEPLLSEDDVRVIAHTNSEAHTAIHVFVQVNAINEGKVTPRDIQQHILQKAGFKIALNSMFAVIQWPSSQSGKCDLKSASKYTVPWPSSFGMQSDANYKVTGIVEQFETVVDAAPNRTALIFKNEKISYASLNAQVNRIAHCLRYEHNIGQDCIVAICASPSIVLIAAILGVLKSGGAFISLSSGDKLQVQEAYTRLSECSAALLLTDKEHENSFIYPRLCIESLTLDNYLAKQNLPCVRTPKSLAYICYTSGSSSKAKGVMIEDFGLHHRLYQKQLRDPIRPTQGYLQLTTPQFDGAIWELFGWIYSSSFLVIIPEEARSNPDKVIHYISEYNIGEILMVPSQLHAFLTYVRNYNYENQLSVLTRIRVGGEAIQRDTIELFKQSDVKNKLCLVNNYGPTETTIDVSQSYLQDLDVHDRITVGRAHKGVELYVLNEQYKEVTKGELGQLAIGGIGLMRGYIKAHGLNQNPFCTHPYNMQAQLYLTGDLAYQTESDEFVIEGRIDDQIKVHGQRVDLSELNTVFAEILPFDMFKVVTTSSHLGSHIVVFILNRAVNNVASLNMEEIKKLIRFKLPDHMIPKAYYCVEDFPTLESGKINRAALLGMHIARTNDEPHSHMVINFYEVVRRVFNLTTTPTADQTLEDLGADSVSIILLAAELKSHLGWQIELEVLTPDRRLESISKLHFSDVNRARYIKYNSNQLPPLFCFPPASGLGFCYQNLAKALPKFSIIAFHFLESCRDIINIYCDDVIRLSQGDIHLLGFSGGGNLAMQVAQELKARGVEIKSLILIDAYIHTQQFKCLPSKISNMRDSLKAKVCEELKSSGLPLTALENRISAYYQFHWKSQIKGQKVNCPILQISTQQQVLLKEINDTPELGLLLHDRWSEWTGQTCIKKYIDTSHYELMNEPYIRAIGQFIDQFLMRENKDCGDAH